MSKKSDTWHQWVGDDKYGVWEYFDYRHVTLTIRRLKNGKFRPNVGAISDITWPEGPTVPVEGYHQIDTFEQAEKFLFSYVDWIREVWDIEAKKNLYKRLNFLHPNIYLN